MSTRRGLDNRQKALLHIYKAAAQLSEAEYRHILLTKAHINSAADPNFTQPGFDRVMCSLETELATRIDTGRVAAPPTGKIKSLTYWRSKYTGPGRINARQKQALQKAWQRLAENLGEAATQSYLLGIIAKACGRRALPHQLSAAEAGMVIDAIKSRLQTAIRSGRKQQEAACPF